LIFSREDAKKKNNEEDKMNPESRIKLIRLLEEIKLYQEFNYASRKNIYFALAFCISYPLVSFFVLDKTPREIFVMILFMIAPATVFFLWLTFRNKLEERYKLLTSAVLELGSIAQENSIPEPVQQKIETKVIKPKKQITKRKKK
jgi:hypothetical protein